MAPRQRLEQAHQLTGEHLRRLQGYRWQLAASWPPSRDPAAAAYLAEVDKLITSVQATFETATANHQTMAGATAALDDARVQLAPIHEEYLALRPEETVRRDQLTGQARMVMANLSTTLAEATYHLATPPDFEPSISAQGIVVNSGDVARVARVAPTPAPVDLPSPVAPTRLHGSATPLQPGPASPRGAISVVPSIIGAPSPVWPSNLIGGEPGGIGFIGPVGRIRTPAGRPRSTAESAEPTAAAAPGGLQTTRPSAQPAVAARVAPAGGVIGFPPGVAPVDPRRSATGSTRRINPTGGVIGTPITPSFTTQDGHQVTIARRPPGTGHGSSDVANIGVSPVLAPQPEPVHDPGPAIGLTR